MIRGKRGFWLLTIIFSFVIMLTVMSPYGMSEISKEMNDTMGNMMKKDHTENLNLADIFSKNSTHHPQEQSASGHSHPLPTFITSISLFSTSLLLLLLPLIMGATAVMVILWI